jgi:6-phosphofructokinase
MEDGSFQDRSAEVIENIEKLGLEAVVVCGGEDTLGVAAKLAQSGSEFRRRSTKTSRAPIILWGLTPLCGTSLK